MEDNEIIELYFKRNESSIRETERKYGSFLKKLSFNILGIIEDSEECVNDTYLSCWNTIPPTKPLSLGAFLARICRNLSINAYNKNHAKKRNGGIEKLLSELSDCVPCSDTLEKETDTKEISAAINTFLESLSQRDRVLFVRRYFYCESLNSLAFKFHITPQKLASLMFSLRKALKSELEKEEVSL